MQPPSAFSRPVPAADGQLLSSGIDLDRITAGAAPALDYLSRAAEVLGIPDPVQEYFGPVVGRWHDLHTQAEQWRRAAQSVEELGERLTTPLGGLDSVWDGRVAATFVEHMQQIGSAGKSASDAMAAMADVLDRTADGVHQLVIELVELLSGGANRVSSALILPVDGTERAGHQLNEIRGYSRRLFEAVRELLEAFAEMCKSMDAEQPFAEVRMAVTFPQQTWSFQPNVPPVGLPVPQTSPEAAPQTPAAAADLVGAGLGGGAGSAGLGGAGGAGLGGLSGAGTGIAGGGAGAGASGPAAPALRTLAAEPQVGQSAAATTAGAAASASAAGAAQRGGGVGGGMMPMGAGMGGGGQDNEHKGKSRISADPTDVFGKPTKTVPPVIGDDD